MTTIPRFIPTLANPNRNYSAIVSSRPLPRRAKVFLTPLPSLLIRGRLQAHTPSGGSGPLRRLRAGGRRSAGAARASAKLGRSGLRPSLVRGDSPRNAPPKPALTTRPASAAPVSVPYPLQFPLTARSPIAHRRRIAAAGNQQRSKIACMVAWMKGWSGKVWQMASAAWKPCFRNLAIPDSNIETDPPNIRGPFASHPVHLP